MNKNRRSKHNHSTSAFNSLVSRESIIRDMEHLFQLALATGKFSVALRAKELIGKEFGMFMPLSKRQKFSFTDLNKDEGNEGIEALRDLEFENRQNACATAEGNAKLQAKIDLQQKQAAAP